MTTAPEPYYADGPVTVWHGDCIDVMRGMPDASVDAVVTDPPYGLEFMGKDWDSFAPSVAASTAARTGSATALDTGASMTTGGFKQGTNGYANRKTPAYGGARPQTNRCTGCGKRDQFRNDHDCEPDAQWVRESINPQGTPPHMKSFQTWCEQWAIEAYRLLKPGGHLLAFGGTRTFHRLAAGIEDAGFEIRDAIGYGRDERPAPQAWVYGSGFPKSLDVPKAIDRQLGAERPIIGRATDGVGNTAASMHKREGFAASREQAYDVTGHGTDAAAAWQGWGTALKPAWEPIVVARKPLAGTVATNVLSYGTGALNVDASRVGAEVLPPVARGVSRLGTFEGADGNVTAERAGRWPANVILDPDAAQALDAQSGTSRATVHHRGDGSSMGYSGAKGAAPGGITLGHDDEGGASRFFKTVTADPPFRYAAKAGTAERPRVTADDPDDGDVSHPTVKPLDLMRYLVRLVTPPGGTVLEPFAGSGTTAEAAVLEGARCIAIEREGDYLPLILQRIRKPHAVGLDLDWDTPTPAPTRQRPAAGNGRDGEPSAARRYTERGGTNFAPLPGRRYRNGPQPITSEPAPGLDFGDDWELDA